MRVEPHRSADTLTRADPGCDHRRSSRCEAAGADALRTEIRPERDCVRVVLAGELDLSTAPGLQAQLRELHQAGCAHIVLDLRPLAFIDCAGLRVLLGAHARAEETATQLTVCCGPGQVMRVLALTGVDHQLQLTAPAIAGTAPPMIRART